MSNRTNRNNVPISRRARQATINAYDLKVNPAAQREFNEAYAAKILANWDDDKFQFPHVNRRADGTFYCIEGQHTSWAYREKYGDPETRTAPMPVFLYDGLTEREEADLFLALNNKKNIQPLPKFRAAVTAGLPLECDIDRIIRANGCVVTASTSTPGAISAVTALRSVYNSVGADGLAATIRVLRDAFGDGGYEQNNLRGVAAVLARYEVAEGPLTMALLNLPRGSKGLSQQAATNREAFGCSIIEATAAAIVDAYNKGKRGKAKLPSWWHVSEDGAA